jgi:putative transposase
MQARYTASRALFQHHRDEHLVQEIRATLHQCRVLGTERCKDAMEAALARRVRPGQPGRPRTLRRVQTALISTDTSSV